MREKGKCDVIKIQCNTEEVTKQKSSSLSRLLHGMSLRFQKLVSVCMNILISTEPLREKLQKLSKCVVD